MIKLRDDHSYEFNFELFERLLKFIDSTIKLLLILIEKVTNTNYKNCFLKR